MACFEEKLAMTEVTRQDIFEKGLQVEKIRAKVRQVEMELVILH